MTDIITNFFVSAYNNAPARSGSKQFALNALRLGADTFLRTPERESLGRLFSIPSSSSRIAGVDSFLAAAKAGAQTSSATGARIGPDGKEVTAQQYRDRPTGFDVFYRRESASETQLKALLAQLKSSADKSASTTATPAASAAKSAAPVISRNIGYQVAEGGSVALDKVHLAATDADTAKTSLVYTVTGGPSHGKLVRTSKPDSPVESFTQADLDSGAVRYVHDGSESSSDSFKFSLSDGTNTVTGSVSLRISAVNDAPEVTRNAGLTVDEGGDAAITSALLYATDPDTRAADTVFDITSGPANGHLEFADDPGNEITQFTRADLNAGRVHYVHDGSETTDDSFTFTVSDGTSTTAEQTFSISVIPVDEPSEPIVNTGLQADEGGTTAISEDALSVSDTDTSPDSIVFTVTSGPSHGQLELSSDPGTPVTQFTQADINAGLLQYVHDGSETTDDSFSFTVTDGTTELASDSFAIGITPVDDAPVQDTNGGATVDEGASVTLSTLGASDVDTDPSALTYTVTGGPSNGYLSLSTDPGMEITSFTQADLDAGLVQYTHDGSETTSDAFTFTLSDGTTTLDAQDFTLSVTPVNDTPAEQLNTDGSVTEGQTTAITASQLLASDPDNTADELTYTVTGTTGGYVAFQGDTGTAITSFTQDDINTGKLVFVHDGGESADAGFGFSLSDGTDSIDGSFSLSVTPVDDAPVLATNTGATVARQSTTTLSSTQLSTTDVDTAASGITYTVGTSPTHGYLQLSTDPGAAVTSFTQDDIDSGRLQYVHTASGAANDSFTFTVKDATTTLASATFSLNIV